MSLLMASSTSRTFSNSHSLMHLDTAHSSQTRSRTLPIARARSSCLHEVKSRLEVEISPTLMCHSPTTIAAGKLRWMIDLKMAVPRMNFSRSRSSHKARARLWNRRRIWRTLVAVPSLIDLSMIVFTRQPSTSNSLKSEIIVAILSVALTPTHRLRLSASTRPI